VVSVTDPYGNILGFLDRSRYFFFQVTPQLYSRGLVDPFPDPLLLRKSGSVGTRTQTSGSGFTFFYITYINSVRTSQETQYISVL
jgi:hypothetical protein